MQASPARRPAGTTTEYWEARYGAGGTSGTGSVGAIRAWKWSVIDHFVGALDDVFDVGCGDLSFWEGRDCPKYLGIDLSDTILRRNRRARPTWAFVRADAAGRLRVHARIVLCMDVLFHVLEESRYRSILENLGAYSDEWLFVCTWNRNPFAAGWSRVRSALPRLGWVGCPGFLALHPLHVVRSIVRGPVSDGSHQRYHSFDASIDAFRKTGLSLVAKHPSPFDAGINAIYVFRRQK